MVDGPTGKDTPSFGTDEMSQFEASVRRHIQGNFSLAGGKWSLEDDSSTYTSDGETRHSHLVTFNHRDSISRIQLSSSGGWVDTDVKIEVYQPLSKAEAREGPTEDVNDLTVTVKTLDMLGEAVWLAEYFARSAEDRIPEDPAVNLHGPPSDSDE